MALAVGAMVATASDDGFVLCPFRACTGGYCPGCGSTRAARSLITGDLAGAWSYSPFVVLVALQLVAVGLSSWVTAPERPLARAKQVAMRLAPANGALLLGIWIVRLADGSIPRFW